MEGSTTLCLETISTEFAVRQKRSGEIRTRYLCFALSFCKLDAADFSTLVEIILKVSTVDSSTRLWLAQNDKVLKQNCHHLKFISPALLGSQEDKAIRRKANQIKNNEAKQKRSCSIS